MRATAENLILICLIFDTNFLLGKKFAQDGGIGTRDLGVKKRVLLPLDYLGPRAPRLISSLPRRYHSKCHNNRSNVLTARSVARAKREGMATSFFHPQQTKNEPF
uniref:Uncharacterized protein n=1 Tax=Cacopsylla melanoneura TaxID=428564 RepID=A0A8D8WSD7_9HEMI